MDGWMDGCKGEKQRRGDGGVEGWREVEERKRDRELKGGRNRSKEVEEKVTWLCSADENGVEREWERE